MPQKYFLVKFGGSCLYLQCSGGWVGAEAGGSQSQTQPGQLSDTIKDFQKRTGDVVQAAGHITNPTPNKILHGA